MSQHVEATPITLHREALIHVERCWEAQLKQSSGLTGEALRHFNCYYLPQVPGWQTEEAENGLLGKAKVITDGTVHMPVMVLMPWNDAEFRTKLDSLRLHPDSVDEHTFISTFTFGYKKTTSPSRFTPLESFSVFTPLIGNANLCMGLRWENSRHRAFYMQLPKDWSLLLDQKSGRMQNAVEVKRIVTDLTQWVDLTDFDLTTHEKNVKIRLHATFIDGNPGSNISAIEKEFDISKAYPTKDFALKNGIPVEISFGRDAYTGEHIMTVIVKKIQVDHDVSENPQKLQHIIRSSDPSGAGDLMITIYGNNKRTAVVMRDGKVDPTIIPVGFTSSNTLSTLLAKLT